ncbi:MAG TPA: RNA methyltransferase [Candidatus Cloacimonadota bacterium]|nr:RNA methyltransferase [Candidatus Cloacimonadota bacterium]
MKKVYHYSKEKFNLFEPEKKERILNDILDALHANWDEVEMRINLIVSYMECTAYSPEVIQPSYQDIAEKLSACDSLEDFLTLTQKNGIFPGNGYRMDQPGIKRYDGLREKRDFPFIGVLHNLRSVFNVGSIFRTAECLGWEKLYLCGHTPTPEQLQVQQSSMATHEVVNWEHREDILEVLQELKAQGYTLYALETSTEAVSLMEVKIKHPAAIIVGNEALGLTEEILQVCDGIIEIPVYGWKNSLNVSVAFAVCGYECNRQYDKENS